MASLVTDGAATDVCVGTGEPDFQDVGGRAGVVFLADFGFVVDFCIYGVVVVSEWVVVAGD